MNFRNFSIIVIFTILFSVKGNTQEQIKPDTINSYVDIFISGGSGGYFLNGERIPKARYEHYKKVLDQIDSCTPCWVKNYNLEEELVSEGLYNTDCCVGDFIEYYSSGSIKAKGKYKSNPTNNWNDWYKKGGCRKEGIWKYYDENGNLIKSETFKDGEVINQ